MRKIYLSAAQMLKTARELALLGKKEEAVRTFQRVIDLLIALSPERVRDVLLAHAYLGYHQVLVSEKGKGNLAAHALHLGVSYARTTRDPLARAIAEECLNGRQNQNIGTS